LDVSQHPLKLRPLHRPARAAPLDELGCDERTYLQSPTAVRLPLGWNRQAVWIGSSSGLASGGDADVGHCPQRRQGVIDGCYGHLDRIGICGAGQCSVSADRAPGLSDAVGSLGLPRGKEARDG